MIHHFVRLNESELSLLLPPLTLFLFPIGGLEQHGPHLPMGTKVFQSEDWVRVLAEKLQSRMPQWNFVIMPTLAMTVDTYTSSLALTVRPHVLRDALVDQCESLKKRGYLQFAAFSTHLSPRQICAIEDAGKIVSKSKKATLVSLTSAWIESQTVFQSPLIALPGEHGGAQDTGYMLAKHPELVKVSGTSLVPVDPPRASPGRFIQYFKGTLGGYWGRPSDANAQAEMERMDRELLILIEKMLPVFEKGKGKTAFHSGYRWFPLNGSFFKAYILAALFFVSLFAWVMWGFRSVLE